MTITVRAACYRRNGAVDQTIAGSIATVREAPNGVTRFAKKASFSMISTLARATVADLPELTVMIPVVEVTCAWIGAAKTAQTRPARRAIPIFAASLRAGVVFTDAPVRAVVVLNTLDLRVELHALTVPVVANGTQ